MAGSSSAHPLRRLGAHERVRVDNIDDNRCNDKLSTLIDHLKGKKSEYEDEIYVRGTVRRPSKLDDRYKEYLQEKVQWLQLTINQLTLASSSMASTIQHGTSYLHEFGPVGRRPDGYETDPGEEYAPRDPGAPPSPGYEPGEYIHRNDGDSDISSNDSRFGSPYY